MKKQALSLLLALSLMSVPALAKENSADNFVRSKTYASQFSDLPEDHTFYENVAALYEYGLSVGQADGTYGLTVPMTVGQAVIFAGRIRSLYRTGDPEAGPVAFTAAAIGLKDAQRVYAPYLWYLQAEGVLDKALDEQLADVATRAQMAHVLANLLPETALPPINDSLITQAYASRRRITDVTEYTPYYDDILKLYRCGISIGSDEASISELLALNDSVLESVYPTKTQDAGTVESFTYEAEKRVAPAVKTARPKALIPVFPGTNCEYDTHRALLEAGADAEQFIIRNLTSADVADSVERFAKAVKDSQIIVIPGGFSGGDEPDGSAKLITAFFRNAAVKEQVTDLLEKRDGLMLGVCNGFQALIKLGLVPYGKIMDTDADFPTLTYNVIGRHQSRLVRTRVCSNKSPWLAGTKVGDIYTVPISHGEGRFLASEELVKKLAENGQIATQYVDLDGYATMNTAFNPNGSICAIEGITSPDGRVFGKMGHTERIGKELYRNVPGQYEMELFTSAVRYFK